jgi:hypothetical protein
MRGSLTGMTTTKPSEEWDEWLADCLGTLDIDADVFGPYVTGIMVRISQPVRLVQGKAACSRRDGQGAGDAGCSLLRGC